VTEALVICGLILAFVALINWLNPRPQKPPSPPPSARQAPAAPKEPPLLRGDGGYSARVTGTSDYQEELERMVGGRTEDSASHHAVATLTAAPGTGVVLVSIDGVHIGYMRPADAIRLPEALQENGISGLPVKVRAAIVGGWDRGPENRGHFGVRLDL